MRRKAVWPVCLLVLTVCMSTLPAMAGATLFSDLGPPGNLYQCCIGWTVAGSGTLGTSFTAANLFTVSGSGNFNVTQIDLGTNYITGTNTFYASIWTDSSGVPGSQVAGAYWGSLVAVACCGLVTIPVSGVSLTGGQSYFMVLGPMNLIDTTWESWNWNNQSINGLDLYSNDGGTTWNSNGTGNPLGAFDVLGNPSGTTPEPSSVLLFGTGLVGAFGAFRRKMKL